jgi:hypothetical protein
MFIGIGVRSLKSTVSAAALALVFAGAQVLDSRITFARNGLATRYDSTGKLTYAPNNQMLQSGSILASSGWIATFTSLSAAGSTNPRGNAAFTNTLPVSNNQHFFGDANLPAVLTVGLTYMFSIDLKSGTDTRAQLTFSSGNFSGVGYVNFNLLTGATLASGGSGIVSSGSVSLGDGWFRYYISAVCTTASAASPIIGRINANAATRLPTYLDTGLTILAADAQLETITYETTPRAYNATTSAAYHGPRFDYDPATAVLNLRASSEVMTDFNGQTTVTSSAYTASNGVVLSNVVPNTSSNYHGYISSHTDPRGYSFLSIFAKANGYKWLRVANDSDSHRAYFNLETGVAGTVVGSGVTSRIESVGDGVYRCTLFLPALVTSAKTYRISVTTGDSPLGPNEVGDGVSGILMGGLHYGPIFGPYVKTTGTVDQNWATPRGLLVEEARTNLLLQSADFNTSWVKDVSSVTSNADTAPDGTVSADLWTSPNNANQAVYQAFTVTASTVYTFSAWIKLGTMSAANVKYATRDDTAGAFIASDQSYAQTITVGGYTRVSFSVTTPVGCTTLRVYIFRNSAAVPGTLYFWGAQCEAGAFATSYIPTISASATRAREEVSMTGTNFSSWFNATEGTFIQEFAVGSIVDTTTRRHVWAGTETGNNRLAYRSVESGVIGPNAVYGTGSGVSGMPPVTGSVLVPNQFTKTAFAYGANGAHMRDGALVDDDPAAASVSVTQIFIGSTAGSAGFMNGWIKSIRYYRDRKTNSQLQALTA